MEENNANEEMNLQGEQVQAENQPVVTQEAEQQVSPITIEQNQTVTPQQVSQTMTSQQNVTQQSNSIKQQKKKTKLLKIIFIIIGIVSLIYVFCSIKWYLNEIELVNSSIFPGAKVDSKPKKWIINNSIYTIIAFVGFFLTKLEKKIASYVGIILGAILLFSAIGFIPGIFLIIISVKYMEQFEKI